MWLNFFVIFGFIAGVIGIPSLGAALDAGVTEGAKQRVGRWVARQSEDLRAARFGGTKVFDKIFGSRVISVRALIATISLSTISVLAGFIIAYFTSSEEIRRSMLPLVDSTELFDVFSISMFVIIVIIGDFISYAQTRIFFAALDRVKNIYVSAILYIADLVLSIGIFVIMYSVAKAIVTIVAITSFYQHDWPVSSRVSPEVILASVDAWNVKESRSITGSLERALSAYTSSPSMATSRVLDREIAKLTYAHPENLITKSSEPIIYCLDDFSVKSEDKTHIYELLRDSEDVGNRAIGLGAVRATFGGAASFSRSLPTPNSGDRCAIHVVQRTSMLSMAKVMRQITWGDFFLGSIALTLHEVETSINTKFSALMYDDQISTAPAFLQYSLMAANSRFLGIGQTRASGDVAFSTPAARAGHVFIPFSILAFSSLSANFIFAIYMMCGLIISTGDQVLNIPIFGKHIKDEAIFFRISISISIFILGATLAIFVLEEAFKGLLWLAFQRA